MKKSRFGMSALGLAVGLAFQAVASAEVDAIKQIVAFKSVARKLALQHIASVSYVFIAVGFAEPRADSGARKVSRRIL